MRQAIAAKLEPGPAPFGRRAPLASLPSYALYGEHGQTEALDGLHCERIAERSRRHDWEIRPHRHASLFQILHIECGAAQAWLEAGNQALVGPCVLLVPALVPHGFVFAPDIEGTVITLLEQHLMRLLHRAPTLADRLLQTRWLAWPLGDPKGQALQEAVARLHDAFAHPAPWRDLALDAALLHLAVMLGRLLPDPALAGDPSTSGHSRALFHVRRLRDLVEAGFRQQPSLATLAATMGITSTQLNRVCHQVLGHSALGVLHGRLVLEAQRDLAYTTQSIKQIGLGLGFVDPGYFTRFFQRLTGHTPTAWRALALR